jgi:hypothetical protein
MKKYTWGKLDINTPKFIVESDATIVAPLIFCVYSRLVNQRRSVSSYKGKVLDLPFISVRSIKSRRARPFNSLMVFGQTIIPVLLAFLSLELSGALQD